MKATFKINQLEFELAAETARDLFQQVAQIQEVFEAETQCGCCHSEEIRYAFREVDSYKYYELQCRECGARFKFGQKKQTNELFPKRLEEGKPLPNGGWAKYEPQPGDERGKAPMRQPSGPAARPGAVIPEFQDWDIAERSVHWGKPIRVAGELFQIPPGKTQYTLAPQ